MFNVGLTILWMLGVSRLNFDALVEHVTLTYLSIIWPKELIEISSEKFFFVKVILLKKIFCQIVNKVLRSLGPLLNVNHSSSAFRSLFCFRIQRSKISKTVHGVKFILKTFEIFCFRSTYIR